MKLSLVFNKMWKYLWILLFILVFPYHAYAYLDVSNGSYIFQVLIAMLMGGIFAIKLFWLKIKNVLRIYGIRKTNYFHGRKHT